MRYATVWASSAIGSSPLNDSGVRVMSRSNRAAIGIAFAVLMAAPSARADDIGGLVVGTTLAGFMIREPTHGLTVTQDDAAWILLEAKRTARRGHHGHAVDLFTAVINLLDVSDPKLPDVYARRAASLVAMGEFEDAAEDYSRALDLEPDQGALYLARANAYRDIGDHEHALDDYARALTLRIDAGQVCRQRGLLYERLGYMDRARADYKRALDQKPRDKDLQQALARVTEGTTQ